MGFLNDIPLRPSCVVTALPRRYRESLARELGGSVAISTCPVEELETAVHQRGASLAVVGVSSRSLEIAERLSHATRQVRVFLAHYKDARPCETPKNGFAGVFDLHDDPKDLAMTIRQAVEETRGFISPPVEIPRRRINLLQHFIEMHKRISNPSALMESMLEGFMKITGADEGLLLHPQEHDAESWIAGAKRGYHVPELGTELQLDQDCLRALAQGEIYTPHEGICLDAPTVAFAFDPYFMAAPVMADFSPRATFIGNSRNHPDDLDEFLEGCSYLFQQVDKEGSTLQRNRLVEDARKVGGASWIMADVHGRVIYREGTEASWFTQKGPNVRHARLLHLLAAALKGKKGFAKVRGKHISYQPLSTVQKSYGILKVEASNTVGTDNCAPFNEVAVLKALLSPILAEMPVERAIYEDLISAIGQSPSKETFEVERLKSTGIEMTLNSDVISAALLNGLSLVLVATKSAVFGPLSARFSQDGRMWSLTIEVPEAGLPEASFDWKNNILINLAIKVARLGNLQFRSSRFGFQLIGANTIC
jgi:hypothetical protein